MIIYQSNNSKKYNKFPDAVADKAQISTGNLLSKIFLFKKNIYISYIMTKQIYAVLSKLPSRIIVIRLGLNPSPPGHSVL